MNGGLTFVQVFWRYLRETKWPQTVVLKFCPEIASISSLRLAIHVFERLIFSNASQINFITHNKLYTISNTHKKYANALSRIFYLPVVHLVNV